MIPHPSQSLCWKKVRSTAAQRYNSDFVFINMVADVQKGMHSMPTTTWPVTFTHQFWFIWNIFHDSSVFLKLLYEFSSHRIFPLLVHSSWKILKNLIFYAEDFRSDPVLKRFFCLFCNCLLLTFWINEKQCSNHLRIRIFFFIYYCGRM